VFELRKYAAFFEGLHLAAWRLVVCLSGGVFELLKYAAFFEGLHLAAWRLVEWGSVLTIERQGGWEIYFYIVQTPRYSSIFFKTKTPETVCPNLNRAVKQLKHSNTQAAKYRNQTYHEQSSTQTLKYSRTQALKKHGNHLYHYRIHFCNFLFGVQ
jgi:hypothetical protein